MRRGFGGVPFFPQLLLAESRSRCGLALEKRIDLENTYTKPQRTRGEEETLSLEKTNDALSWRLTQPVPFPSLSISQKTGSTTTSSPPRGSRTARTCTCSRRGSSPRCVRGDGITFFLLFFRRLISRSSSLSLSFFSTSTSSSKKKNQQWEDPACEHGGKWTVLVPRGQNSKATLDTMWLNTLLAAIGEQFAEGDEVCGIVVNIRPKQDKVRFFFPIFFFLPPSRF